MSFSTWFLFHESHVFCQTREGAGAIVAACRPLVGYILCPLLRCFSLPHHIYPLTIENKSKDEGHNYHLCIFIKTNSLELFKYDLKFMYRIICLNSKFGILLSPLATTVHLNEGNAEQGQVNINVLFYARPQYAMSLLPPCWS